MGRRNKTQENLTLLQLQNYIKRDPGSYRDEFTQQYRYYQSNLKIFQLQPSQPSKTMIELIMFISQVAHCYPEDLDTFPQELIDLIRQYQDVLDTDLRLAICRALILIRNKNLLSPTSLLELFFELFRCKDKLLRKTLYNHIVADISNINLKHKNNKVNKALQGFMYKVLCDGDALATRYSVEVMIELYKKSIWNDSKTVNAIVLACFSNVAKARVIAVKFFLGTDDIEDGSDSDDSDDAKDPTKMKGLLVSHNVSKKTKKKKKTLEKALAALKKHKKKRSAKSSSFSALYLINDPQAFAEKLYKELEKAGDKFEIRIMIADLISRLVGLHQLFLFNFYPYLQRYLQPHQQEVTKFLTFVARSSHDLIPPETLEPVLRTIVNNFVTERNSSEVMAVGLNAVREMCAKCPNVMTEELLQDLTQYKSSKNKSVLMAARSLIQLYRYINPSLLRKKDRGKPMELSKEVGPLAFSEVKAAGHVPGTEFLEVSENVDGEEEIDSAIAYGMLDSDEGTSYDDAISLNSEGEDDDASSSEEIPAERKTDKRAEKARRTMSTDSDRSNSQSVKARVALSQSKTHQAEDISSSRFLTPEEFDKIRTEKVLRELDMRTGGKMKRKHLETMVDNEMEKELSKPIISQDDIEIIHKKARHDRESRLATVKEGREGRGKFTNEKYRMNEFASTSHKEKRKGKSFMMVRQAKGVQRKIKRSFRQKQLALRDSMLKRRKSKR
ncbi:Protein SDA1-like protein [Trichoplax sp. H2]|nr:Protein SDA1-like protein [Trichoplax sp. H2]|eukprot:RDD43610.1 Protein SDA1-like protein [Trichoplax sp. H2]